MLVPARIVVVLLFPALLPEAGAPALDAEDQLNRHPGMYRRQEASIRHQLPDTLGDRLALLPRHEIDLVENNNIGHVDLSERKVEIIVAKFQELVRIHHRDNAVDAHHRFQLRTEKGLRDQFRIRDFAGFHQDAFRRLGPGKQPRGLSRQVVAHRATNAAVGQADGLTFDAHHELGVNVDRTKIIDQHRDP
jgi:hypothetical protein